MGYPIAAQSPKIELSATFIVQTLTKEVVSSMGSATRLGICSWEALGISPGYLHDIPICSLQPVYLGPHFFKSHFKPRTVGAPCGVAGELPSPTSRLACLATPKPAQLWPCPRRVPWQGFLRFFWAKVLRILGQLPSGKRLHS